MGQSPESSRQAFFVMACGLRSRNDAVVGFILTRTERGLLAIHFWDNRPRLLSPVATAIATVKRHDPVCFGLTTRPYHLGVCLVPRFGIVDTLRQERYHPAALKGPNDDGRAGRNSAAGNGQRRLPDQVVRGLLGSEHTGQICAAKSRMAVTSVRLTCAVITCQESGILGSALRSTPGSQCTPWTSATTDWQPYWRR